MPGEEKQVLSNSWEWINQVMTIETFIKLSIIYFFVVWIAIIVWVFRDITSRSNSFILQALSLMIVILLSPLGVFIYLLIRPTQTLFETYYKEVEQNLDLLAQSISTKLEIKKDHSIGCPKCQYPIDNAFKFCPNCKEELKYECKSCHKKIDKSWKVCAHCGEKNPYEEKIQDTTNIKESS